MRAWRPALRIARREVLRSRGRNVLVVAMVGLPVALVTTLATLYVTNEVSSTESIPLRLGSTAAELQSYGGTPVAQNPDGDFLSSSDAIPIADPAAPLTADQLRQLTGGRVIDLPLTGTVIATERGSLRADALITDPSAPELSGMFNLLDGRLPRADNEVLVTRHLVERGFGPGLPIALADGALRATVVGVIAVPLQSSDQFIVARPGLGLNQDENTRHRYLLDRSPVLWPEVRELNKLGVGVFSRAVVQNPPTDWRNSLPAGTAFGSGADQAGRAILALVIFSVVLEVVLLAGPAFAVGVRRQSRQLALVAAAGGTRGDVRRVVLAQALVLGAGSAVIGAAVGIAAAAVTARVLPRVSTSQLGPWQVDWRYVGAAAALGALASVAAALGPAISAARSDVVAVLAGRRGQAAPRRGWPVLGAAVFAAGAALTLTLGTRQGGEFMVAGGTLLMVIGAIALMPLLIGLVGRLGSHLPMPLRLATRDSARQRSRTAPAVAAVMAAVAGVTTLAIAASSDFEQRRIDYQPRSPQEVSTLELYGGDVRTWRSIEQATSEQVDGRRLLAYGSVGTPTDTAATQFYVPRAGCPTLPTREAVTPDQSKCQQWMVADPARTDSPSQGLAYSLSSGLVAEPDALAALGYRLDAEQRAVLNAGGVLLPDAALVRDGQATLTTFADDGIAYSDVRTRVVRAGSLTPFGVMPTINPVVVTPSGAKALGLSWSRTGGVLSAGTAISTATQNRWEESVRAINQELTLYTERGFVMSFTLPLLGLAGVAVLIVLIGTLTATGLALADSRPDLTTLAAVGARPRTRRVMAAAQALVIGLLGAVTGVAVGFLPGIAAAYPLTSSSGQPPIIAVPWLLLLAVAVAVPVLAAAAAGAGVRSRLPLTRRLGQ